MSAESRDPGPYGRRLAIHYHLIEEARTVGIHRFAFGKERSGAFDALAEADLRAKARAQLIEDDRVFAVRFSAAPEGFQAVRDTDHEAIALERRMGAVQRHGADHFSDAH